MREKYGFYYLILEKKNISFIYDNTRFIKELIYIIQLKLSF